MRWVVKAAFLPLIGSCALRGGEVKAPPPAAATSAHQLVAPANRPSTKERDFVLNLAGRPLVTDSYDATILKYAQKHRLNPRFVKAIIATESEFDPACVSPMGAKGLMQLLPGTSEEMGVPGEALEDPDANIRAGTAYLHGLFRIVWKRYHLKGRYRDAPVWVLQRVIAAYHAGPRAVQGPKWRPSTRRYVRKVLLYYRSPVTVLRAGGGM